MPTLLIVEPDPLMAESVAEHLQAHVNVLAETAHSLEAAREKIDGFPGNYLTLILNLSLSPENYAPFPKIPTIVITGRIPTSAKKIAFASNVLDYIPDYNGYNLEYITQLVKRALYADESKILIADDERTTLNLMHRLLANKGYVVHKAGRATEVLDYVRTNPDIRMLIIDGDICEQKDFDLIRTLRQDFKKNQLSIIALCERSKEFQRTMLLRSGVNDCIEKPFRIEDFQVRVMNNLQLVEVLKELTEHSNRDFLTQLYNRRYFFEIGSTLYENYKRGALHLTLAMLDIDHLKTINDTHGHLIGDKAIKTVAEVLTTNLRATDVLARLGGEEFCVLSTDVKPNEARNLFERIRKEVHKQSLSTPRGSIRFSVSIGVTTGIAPSFEDMIHAGDMLLYEAKQQGRNRVVHR